MNRVLWMNILVGCVGCLWGQPVSEYSYAGAPSQSVRLFNASRVNSLDLEFCPVVYENGLVYVSRYTNGPIDPTTGETYFELFYAEFDPNGMPAEPSSFSTEINSAYHEGPVSFNRDYDRIFFTRTNSRKGVRRSDSKGRSGLKIYEAKRGPFDWEDVQELPFNNDNYSCMHPALSPDESKLFFASNRPGGFGGMDLYVSDWKNGHWSAPINLGPEVNTSKNEAFPFFHESGVLFFSSDGHPGQGGLDLFLIDMSGRQWGEVLNLGPPFNSPEDDLGFVLLPDGFRGYLSSARSGGFGKDDVYMFYAPDGLKGIKPVPILNGVISATDKSTSRRMSGVSIRLFELNEEGLIDDDNAYDFELMPDESGEEMVMKLNLKKEEELGSPDAVTDRNGESVLQLNPDKNYLLLLSKPSFFTQEFRFSTDELGPIEPLDFLLEPSNCIMLKGVAKSDRFQIPIPGATIQVTNDCGNKTEVFRTNMRGEYEICLPLGCSYSVSGSKPGYESGSTQVTTIRLRGSRSLSADISMHPTSDAILREPIREGTVIVLENIYYDFNKSAIRKGAARDLEALVQLMTQYPTMQIELGAHTDSRGTNDYNLNLSVRRANSAKAFLVQRGIAGGRIQTVGYGESQPRNHCIDGIGCDEEEYLLNRRTEVKVLNIDERIEVRYDDDGNGQ